MLFNGFVVGAYLRVRASKTTLAIKAMTGLIVGATAKGLTAIAN